MVGRKLDARVVDAMITSHLFAAKSRTKEWSYLYANMQLFVFVLRACNFSPKSQLFCMLYMWIRRNVYDDQMQIVQVVQVLLM